MTDRKHAAIVQAIEDLHNAGVEFQVVRVYLERLAIVITDEVNLAYLGYCDGCWKTVKECECEK